MKKTLFALLATIFTSSIYAAAYNWSFDAEGNAPFSNATYFAINGDISAYVTTLTTAGQGYDSFVNSLVAGSYSTNSLDSVGAAAGSFENDAASTFGIIVFESTAAGSTFYYQVADTAGYTYEPPAGAPGAVEIWAFDEDGYLDMSTGEVAAVPEPTVLALLALGVAGVALRRKKVVA